MQNMLMTRTCNSCGRTFQGGPRAYYCPECRDRRRREQAESYRRRKRSGDTRPLGSMDKCERCGNVYSVMSGNQRFCEKCQPIHSAEYDRETSISFYHENKERINPPRKIKRRKTNSTCSWCRKEFEPVNGSVTCSDECRRQHKNRQAREWSAKKAGKR